MDGKRFILHFLPSHLFVSEEETDQHCVLLNAEHVADVQGAAGEQEVEEEGDEDAHGEQQVEAGEPDQHVEFVEHIDHNHVHDDHSDYGEPDQVGHRDVSR